MKCHRLKNGAYLTFLIFMNLTSNLSYGQAGLAFRVIFTQDQLNAYDSKDSNRSPASASTESFSLFNPKPRKEWRDLSTDRPTRAPSPYSMDAGRYLIESDIANYTYNRNSAVATVDQLVAFPVLTLRAGLLDSLELQVTAPSYNIKLTDINGLRAPAIYGIGDTFARLKINMIGNRGGRFALALMPSVKLPTNQNGLGNNHIEGAFTVPVSYILANDWGLGGMLQIDLKRNPHVTWEGSASAFVSHTLIGSLTAFAEIYGKRSIDLLNSPFFLVSNVGLVFKATSDFQIDLGSNIGLTEIADDFNPYCGVAYRF